MKKLFSKTKMYRWLLLLVIAAVAICIALIAAKVDSIPGWVSWETRMEDLTVNTQDSTAVVGKICLSKKNLIVTNADDVIVFQTNKDIKVQDFLYTDVDHDGQKELVALVWKRGKFGKHRPFWIETDETNYSQHIFIYEVHDEYNVILTVKNGDVTPKWFASDIGVKVKRMKVLEKNESIILTESIDGTNTLWTWKSWGLEAIENEVKFVAFGDNIIHEAIYQYAGSNEGGSFDFLYEPFKEEIESADIAAVNAETVLVDNESMVSGYPSFGSPVSSGQALVSAGFDVISCANNHIADKGIGALDFTRDFYDSNGVTCIGIQKSTDKAYRGYELISRNGMTIALFSYTYGTNVGDVSEKYSAAVHYLPRNEEEEQYRLNELKDARSKADIVIVFAHWGDEYSKEVRKEQRRMAQLFAKGGADVVIGTHPHVVQSVEKLKRPDGGETVVYYSLGNFRADQWRDKDTKIGAEAVVIFEHAYEGSGVKDFQVKEINSYWKGN